MFSFVYRGHWRHIVGGRRFLLTLLFWHSCWFSVSIVALIHYQVLLFTLTYGFWLTGLNLPSVKQLWPSTTQWMSPLSNEPQSPSPKISENDPWGKRLPFMFVSSRGTLPQSQTQEVETLIISHLTDEKTKARIVRKRKQPLTARTCHSQLVFSLLLNINNFTRHQHHTRPFCDHHGSRQRQDPSVIHSEPRQNKNIVHTSQIDQRSLSQPTWVLAAASPITAVPSLNLVPPTPPIPNYIITTNSESI